MSLVVQTTYQRHLNPAFVGQLSRPNQPFYCIRDVIAGQALEAGDGVYFDTVSSKYLTPTDAGTALKVAGVVRRVYFSQNLDTNGDIVTADGDNFELLTSGHIYVTAGAAVTRGAVAAMATDGSHTWVIGTGNEATLFVFDDDAAMGDVVSISTVGQTKAIP